ncbi:MAG: nucleotidyltransferase domain-containing protein [Lysobacterales bacterium]
MQNLTRTALVSLNELAAFRVAGSFLYRMIGRGVAAACRRLEDVQALYLTGSMASGDLAPGLSDIDIILVIRDLPVEREFQLIRKIEALLRYVLPPFGQDKAGKHMMIYSATEWEGVGDLLLGKRSGGPRVLFDKCGNRAQRAIGSRVRCLHHLLKAHWRLEDLQNRMSAPSAEPLDALLRLRTVDRLVGALESACMEVDGGGQAGAEVAALAAELRRDLAPMQMGRSDADLPLLLPKLLLCFDQAVWHSLREDGPSRSETPWSANGRAGDCANLQASLALAEELLPTLQNAAHAPVIHAARVGEVDFVVCDPLALESLCDVVGHYRARPGRILRLASFRTLRAMYLNDAFGPLAFVRLGDRAPVVATGQLSLERFMLEAYAAFPRVRALRKLDDPVVFEAYGRSLLRLLRFAGHPAQCAGQGQNGRVLGSEARFAVLRRLSAEVSSALDGEGVASAGDTA